MCQDSAPTTTSEPPHDKTSKVTVRPAKISLGIRPVWSVFAVRSVGSLGPELSSCGQQTLIRLGGCPGWSESSLGAHVILLVLSLGGSSGLCKAWNSVFVDQRLTVYVQHLEVIGEGLWWATSDFDAWETYDANDDWVELQKWAAARKNQQNDCAPSEDSDQSGHPPSLIIVFAVRMKKVWVLSYPLSAQRRLRSDWAYAHSHFVGFVMRRLKELLCLRRKFSLKPPCAEVEFSNDAEGFVISIYW